VALILFAIVSFHPLRPLFKLILQSCFVSQAYCSLLESLVFPAWPHSPSAELLPSFDSFIGRNYFLEFSFVFFFVMHFADCGFRFFFVRRFPFVSSPFLVFWLSLRPSVPSFPSLHSRLSIF